MFYTRKPKRNWLFLSSAILGGFLLGFSYKNFGKNIKNSLQKMTKGKFADHNYPDYTENMEPDV